MMVAFKILMFICAILSFFGCLAATKGTALLAGKIAFCIKKTFVRREDVG